MHKLVNQRHYVLCANFLIGQVCSVYHALELSFRPCGGSASGSWGWERIDGRRAGDDRGGERGERREGGREMKVVGEGGRHTQSHLPRARECKVEEHRMSTKY